MEAQLIQIKLSLEKSLALDDLQNQSESVMDQLVAIERTAVTSELISKSGLGNTIASIKDKFSAVSSSVSEKAKSILVSWKAIVKASKTKSVSKPGPATTSVSKTAPATASVQVPTTASTPTPTLVTTPAPARASSAVAQIDDSNLSFKNDERLSLLVPPRRAVANIFRNIFKGIPLVKAVNIALEIEEELNKKHSYDLLPKQYSSKAKTLSFNLTKNESLREHVQNNQVSSEKLLSMTDSELASKQVNIEREKARFESVDGRRLDWLEEHKEEIQKNLGIDPNNKWDYDDDGDELSEPDIE